MNKSLIKIIGIALLIAGFVGCMNYEYRSGYENGYINSNNYLILWGRACDKDDSKSILTIQGMRNAELFDDYISIPCSAVIYK